MAERIKGLQIDLSMRDMGVAKTLAGVKREFRSLNSSLKLSGNNFKYGEKNAASYKSRMNDLDGAIKVGTSNLKQLETQYKQVSQEQGANSAKAIRLQTEYDKQANSINALKDEYGRLDQYYKQNFSSMGQLSNRFKSIGTGMQDVGTKAQTMGQSLTSKITKPALLAGGALAGIAITKGFGRLVEIDTAKAKLSALGNSAKDTNTIMDNAMESVKGTSFGMGEAATTAANAVAAGIKPGKELTKYLTTTGDAAAVAGVDMSEMGRTLNKVQTQNKAYNGELQELSDRGLPIYQWLAKEAGVTGEQVTEMASKGEISSKMLQEAIRNNIGGAAKEMGQKSFTASVQNMWAAVGRLGAAFLDAGGKGGGFFSKLKPIMNNLTETFDKMGPQAEQWGVALGNTFSKVIDGISGIVKWYQGLDGGTQKTLGGLAKWLGIVLFTMGPVLTIFGKFTSVIGGMFSGMSGLIQFFIRHNVVSKVSATSQAIWNGVTATARGIANGYRYAIAALSTSQTAQAIKTKIASAATVVWTGVTKAAALATKGLGLALRFMTGPVGIVITAITALVGGIIYLWKTNSTFRNVVISAWNAIKNTAIAVFGFLKPYIIGIWNALKTSAITIWNAIKYAVQHPIQALKTILSTLWNGMKAAAIKIWTLLKNGVIAIIKAYVNQVRSNFNLVKRIVTTIFNAIKSFAIKVWNTIKNSVINIVKGLKNGVVNTFNILSRGIHNIFNAVKNFALKLWTNIKNGVVSRAKALWNGVKTMFNNLKNSINSITSKIRSFLYSIWNAIKNKVVDIAKSLWNGVKDKFNGLKTSISNIIKKVKNNLVDTWNSIKSKVIDIASGLWSKVKGIFNNMKDGLKDIIGKIKGHITGMVDAVKSGLNGLIKGLNWVGSKLGLPKIPKLSTGTQTINRQIKTTGDGALKQGTMAVVGDKGPGNGKGKDGRREMIRYPNGRTALTPAKDTTTFLPKGSSVVNGATTQKMLSTGTMPRFNTGTIDLPHFSLGSWVKDKAIDTGKWVGNTAKKGYVKTKEAVGDGAKWLGGKVKDVMDYMDNPGKLLDLALDAFGVDFSQFEGGNLVGDITQAAWKKIRKSAIQWIKSGMEAQGGDGSVFDGYRIMQPFSAPPKKPNPNYPFNGGVHYGVDYDMKEGTPVKTPMGGKVRKWYDNYGGGNAITVTKGKTSLWFMHLAEQLRKTGEQVKAGQLVGKSGNTGSMTNYRHLHFQVMNGGESNGNAIDPVPWLKKNSGGGANKPAKQWIPEIKRAAKQMKVNLSGGELNGIVAQIQRESNGNAGVTQGNIGDINNLRGTPAKGLLQYVPSTFKSYAVKGHGNITSGYDQLLAFFNNSNWRKNLPYGRSGWGPTGSRRFATGGLINSSGLYNLAEEGHPEFVIPTDPSRQSDAMKLLAIARQRIEGNKKNKRPNQMRTPSTGGSNSSEIALMKQQLEATKEQNNLLMQLLGVTKNIEGQPKGFTEKDVSQAQGNRARIASYNLGL